MLRVLIPLIVFAAGCATHTAGTSTAPTPDNTWEVIPLAAEKAPADSYAPSRAILVNKQTGDTWVSDTQNTQWRKMSRD